MNWSKVIDFAWTVFLTAALIVLLMATGPEGPMFVR